MIILPDITRFVFDEIAEQFTIQDESEPPVGIDLTGKTVYLAMRENTPNSVGEPTDDSKSPHQVNGRGCRN